MKLKKLSILACFIPLLHACIKDTPLNPEADITSFTIDSADATSEVFIDQANSRILLYLTNDAYEAGITPEITITEGATISPASGQKIDFSSGAITYVVTSQSKAYQKSYTIEVVSTGDWKFDFEDWAENERDKYQYPVEEDGSILWSSGNPGTALAGLPKRNDAYPLRATTDAKFGSQAAELLTIKGTALSSLLGIKLFAGSLFLGVFDSQNALIEPLKATKFGQPLTKGRPASFSGYYKYTPGAVYQDKQGNAIPGKTDECSIYAILYTGSERLDATNIKTSDRIIARAIVADGTAKEAYTRFEIPFVYEKAIQPNESLMVAIVASSSKDGDAYIGAIGSRLVVDSLQINMKETK
ncbi:putative glycosyl hydrolase or carbohydrate binding protein [Chitinophaga skermanii]|uniref:Putative glycosyl hydrolase or carbohydrate binding protein n=1 Tax=Chitinophaga skermanii TaxID=331697 RepID=A0A327QTM3_9BACT|nr:PCMD domain-containing protein [Chitinophaga skermanii]RAJ07014.1 putative glycosyl hydrolase or carbohydrate binding protein [Chitinophaga skermanii]